MTVERLIDELRKFPKGYEVFAVKRDLIFCRVPDFDNGDDHEYLVLDDGGDA